MVQYIWPNGRYDIKFRIVLALFILILAKIITVLVPYIYKWSTDSILGNNTMPNLLPAAVFTPIILIISFGIGRTMMVGFNQLRDALFAKVGQNAVRSIGRDSFNHIHNLLHYTKNHLLRQIRMFHNYHLSNNIG